MPRTAVRGGKAAKKKMTRKKAPTRHTGIVVVRDQVLGSMADEYGRAEAELSRLMREHPEVVRAAALAKKLEGYKPKLRKQGPEAAADQGATGATPIIIEGDEYAVELGAAGKKKSADKAALFDKVGKARFLELCDVTIKNVEDYVPKPEREGILNEDPHGGTRKLNVRTVQQD